jgi:hypothetical protein
MTLCYQDTSVNFLRQKGVLITYNGSLFPYGKRTSKILPCLCVWYFEEVFLKGNGECFAKGSWTSLLCDSWAVREREREWGKNTVRDGETLQLAAVSYKSPFLKIGENRSLWVYKMANQWSISPQHHEMIVLDFLTGSSRTMSCVTDGSEINFRGHTLSLSSGSFRWQRLPPSALMVGTDSSPERWFLAHNLCF